MKTAEEHYCQVMAVIDFIKKRIAGRPDIGIILGTGQDLLTDEFTITTAIDYAEIPNFPQPTVPGHQGRLLDGELSGKHCLIFHDRFHSYEGHDPRTIAMPVRVMAGLGCQAMIITNTAGGLNLSFCPGELMVISDHINFIGGTPLRGANREEWGPRFPDMSRAYSPRLMDIAQNAAARIGVSLRSGIYVGIPGPNLETPAETRFLRMCGGDAVGMSTIPEVIAAVHGGIEVLGLSIIANINNPDQMEPIVIDQVMEQVTRAAGTARRLLAEIIKAL